MNELNLYCQDILRHEQVRDSELNGLDYLEVSPDDQRKLVAFLVQKASADLMARFKAEHAINHFVIEGGRRIRDVKVIDFLLKHPRERDKDDYLEIIVNHPGDFSDYTLQLVELDVHGRPTGNPMLGIDPRYAAVRFNFKSDCPLDLDCKQKIICPPEKLAEPDIDYLAKDYASFRQLVLDRLAQIMPEWQERHVPDIGIAVSEVMAYMGDYLSYYQDAVATEAYLDTARQRISVRRHARLVDYHIHEGNNARTWVHVKLEESEQEELSPKEFYFITSFENAPKAGQVILEADLSFISKSSYDVFEPLVADPNQAISIFEAHNEIYFYTWGDQNCCLPKGATHATLVDTWVPSQVEYQQPSGGLPNQVDNHRKLNLNIGDFLLFEEVIGPETGRPEDADSNHRHVVRLTRVEKDLDTLYNIPIVHIEWSKDDALPFPICISAIGSPPECHIIENITVARGNIILADHGRSIYAEDLGTVGMQSKNIKCIRKGRPSDFSVISESFQPILKDPRLTFSEPLGDEAPASGLLEQNPRHALPQTRLSSTKIENGAVSVLTWQAVSDLLASLHDDTHFVVEMDNNRQAHLRFGDGELGQAPEAGMRFTANYRIGNGSPGNIGAERLVHLVHRNKKFSGVRLFPNNPVPAQGGQDPEPLAEVKLYAPTAFRKKLERAITPDDYARLAEQNSAVQRASATMRWTGSWYEVLVAIDPYADVAVEADFLANIQDYLNLYRRMGHDLKVALAQYIPLDIAMVVCVLPGYLRGHVKAELLEIFSNRIRSDGKPGYFHPDNLTFGFSIRLSNLIALARTVTGVENVIVTRLERLYKGPNDELINGILPIGPLEIARLDNDPSFPENGRLELIMRGGR